MTATVPVGVNGSGRAGNVRLGTPLPTRQRQPGYVALAVALIVGLGALGAYFYAQAGAKTPVVVVVVDVPAGHPITRADLSTVAVAGAVTAIAGTHLDSVIGKTAAVELLPHTLLQRAMVTDADPLAPGQAEVGVAVRSGQIPADGLVPGDTVAVLALPSKDTAPAAGATEAPARVLVGGAQVFSTREDPSAAGGTLVTVTVPGVAAPAVAAASGAGLVALVKVPHP